MLKIFCSWFVILGLTRHYNGNARFEISYLSDPLADLFLALSKLLKGESDYEEVAFWDEPGLHLLVISKREESNIDVSILWSDSRGEEDSVVVPISERQVVYTDTDTLTNFASVICAGNDSLLERHTLKEYTEKWQDYPFPREKYEQLKQAI